MIKTKHFFTLYTIYLLSLFFLPKIAAQVKIYGSTGIVDATQYSTLKGAFDAIYSNASGLMTDAISLRVIGNTDESAATAVLGPSLGIATASVVGGSSYDMPTVTITGGTYTTFGSLSMTIHNGIIVSLTFSGGTWSVVPTSIVISGGSGSGATAIASGFSYGNPLIYLTNGGTGYGPIATVTGGGGSGAIVGLYLTSTNALGAGSPCALGFGPVSMTYAIDKCGSGYTSTPTISVTGGTGTTPGTFNNGATTISTRKYASVNIYPVNTGITISSTLASGPTIQLLGSHNVTIDGRLHDAAGVRTGSTQDLTITNTSTAGNNNTGAVYICSGADYNTVKYCNLKSSNALGQRATVAIGSSTTAGGDHDSIAYNIFSSSDGINGSLYYISALTSSTLYPNNLNVIDNNLFKDCFTPGSVETACIKIFGDDNPATPPNTNWTISNNSFYQTSALATTAVKIRYCILIGSATGPVYGGYGHTISNNYFGGSGPQCAGTLTKTGSYADGFYGVLLYSSSGGTACSLQGNTMKNINWSNGTEASSWHFINVNGYADMNIGNVTGNVLGDNTTTGSVTITQTGNSSFNAINIATTGTTVCQNNRIGSLAFDCGTLNTASVRGILKSAVSGSYTISNNTIGGVTNSISLPASNNGNVVCGIWSLGTGAGNIYSNTIGNVTNNGPYTYGINIENSTGSVNVYNNFITDLSSSSSLNSGQVHGITCVTGTYVLKNNVISLQATNPAYTYGIQEDATVTNGTVVHNTVKIGGTSNISIANSAALYSSATNIPRVYKNNLFINTRSNGTGSGKHYAANLTTAGTGSISIDGNDYLASGTGNKLGKFGATDYATFTLFQGATAQDASSLDNVDPSFANSTGTTAIDYKPAQAGAGTLVGVGGTSVTTDMVNKSRCLQTIGAYELNTVNTISSNQTDAVFTNSCTDVTVTGVGTTLTIGANKTINSLTLEAGAKLNFSGAYTLSITGDLILKSDLTNSFSVNLGSGAFSITGTMKYYKKIDDQKWYFISLPSDVTIAQITSTDNPLGVLGVDWFLRYYNGAQRGTGGGAVSNWIPIVNADIVATPSLKLNKKQGYIFGLKNAKPVTELSFTLDKTVLLSEPIARTVTVAENAGAAGALHQGWNLIGQPYLSKYQTSLATGADTYYMYVSDGVSTYTAYDPAVSAPDLEPMSAYFVQASSALAAGNSGNGLSFDLSGRRSVSSALKTNSSDRVLLNFSNPTGVDQTVLIIDEAQSTNFQVGKDLEKWIGIGTNKPQVYSRVNGLNLAYNALSSQDVKDLPVGFYSKSAGPCTISANLSLAPNVNQLLLTDHETSVVTDLMNSDYNFTASAGTNNSRFTVSAHVNTPIPTSNSTLFESPNYTILDGKLVLTNIAENSKIRISNLLGQFVFDGNSYSNSIEIPLNSPGVYTVQMKNGTKTWNFKIVNNK